MSNLTIGIDLAKNVFQVHGIGSGGQVVIRRELRRSEVVPFFAGLARTDCLIALEACASAHFWGRTLRDMGHRVVLLPLGRRSSGASATSPWIQMDGCWP